MATALPEQVDLRDAVFRCVHSEPAQRDCVGTQCDAPGKLGACISGAARVNLERHRCSNEGRATQSVQDGKASGNE